MVRNLFDEHSGVRTEILEFFWGESGLKRKDQGGGGSRDIKQSFNKKSGNVKIILPPFLQSFGGGGSFTPRVRGFVYFVCVYLPVLFASAQMLFVVAKVYIYIPFLKQMTVNPPIGVI